MKISSEGWGLVPNFADRLSAAMDYAGLTNRQLSDHMNDLGLLGMNANHIHRILKGRADQNVEGEHHPNPTFIVIAAMARSCGVSVEWFFGDRDVLVEEQDDLYDRYAQNLLQAD